MIYDLPTCSTYISHKSQVKCFAPEDSRTLLATTVDDAHLLIYAYTIITLLPHTMLLLYLYIIHVFKLHTTAKLYTTVKLYTQLHSSEGKVRALQLLLILLQRLVNYVQVLLKLINLNACFKIFSRKMFQNNQ